MVHTGEQTPQALWLNMESHKLHEAFTVATAVTAGSPVKLNAAGAVVPLGASDGAYLILGYALNSKAVGQEVTVAMRGYARITALAGADSQTAGPVKWASTDVTTGRQVYVAAADAATTQAMAIMGGDEDDEIEVVLLA